MMKRLDTLFTLHRARSDIFTRYKPGDVPYVGNGLSDNAVAGLVKPKSGDKVFDFMGIAVSAFCEATVQAPPYIGCGRAGNGIVVLQPKSPMTPGELACAAAYINLGMRWRFSWYWQTTVTRLSRLQIPDLSSVKAHFKIRDAMPTMSKPLTINPKLSLERFTLGSIYDLQPGDYHSVGNLPAGAVPVVSCGDLENGVCGYFEIKKHVYRHKMTIAFNGSTLSAKYHPYLFAAKDDVAVCFPKQPLRLTTELFIQVMLSREQWRFSYYRKCYKQKLERVTVPLPAKDSKIDEETIENLIQSTTYWSFLKERLHSPEKCVAD
ncbi:MAG: hypothetical protein ABSD29_19610 [Verrucomicrobiota bacterium]|jgi:hypothetical protein